MTEQIPQHINLSSQRIPISLEFRHREDILVLFLNRVVELRIKFSRILDAEKKQWNREENMHSEIFLEKPHELPVVELPIQD